MSRTRNGADPSVVVHTFGAMDVGGAEMRTIELMREMRGRGITFHFVALSGRRGVLADDIEAAGGVVHALPLNLRFPWRFVRLLRRLRAGALDSHVATFSGVLCFLGSVAGVPVRIARFHSDGDGHADTWRRDLQRRAMRTLVAWSATSIVGVSPSALARGYGGRSTPRTAPRVLPNGIDQKRLLSAPTTDLRKQLGLGSGALLCLHVGRPSSEKNRERLPHVIAALRRRGLDAHVVLVGPRYSAEEARVMAAASAAGVGAYVHVVGPRTNVGGVLRAADVLILTSTREGLPGVVLEAAAVGTPVVSSDVPGALWIASQLPVIFCLGLDRDDEAWAEAVVAATADRTEDDRRQSIRIFSDSPFSLDRSVAVNLHLYRPVEGVDTL
jgi:glycosyltransferase involved in cell wall biosynthesis